MSVTLSNTGCSAVEDFSCYNGEGTVLRKAQMRLLEMLVEFDRICKKHDIQYFLSGGTCLGAVRHGGFIPWDDDVDIDIWHSDFDRLVNILNHEVSERYFVQTDRSDPAFARKYLRLVDRKSTVRYEDNIKRESFRHHGLWIDVFPLEKCLSYSVKKNIDYLYTGSMMNLQVKRGRTLKSAASVVIFPLASLSAAIISGLSRIFASDNKISHMFGTGMAPRLNYKHCFPSKPLIFEGHDFQGPADPHTYLENLYGCDYMSIPPKRKRAAHAESIQVY